MKLFILLFLLCSCNILKTISGGQTKVDDDFVGNRISNPYLHVYSNYVLEDSNLRRTHFAADNEEIRTIHFDYDHNNKLDCSIDNGGTWFACGPDTYIWKVEHFNIEHVVRVYSENGFFEQRFTPNQFFSEPITFLSCTKNITTNMTITDFNALPIVSGDVVCFDDGVIITADAAISFLVHDSNVTYLAREFQFVEFINNNSLNIIDLNMKSDVKFIGLSFDGNLQGQTGVIIDENSLNVTIESVSFFLSGLSSRGLSINNLYNNTPKLLGLNVNTSSSGAIAIFALNSDLIIKNSDIYSFSKNIDYSNNQNAIFRISNSFLNNDDVASLSIESNSIATTTFNIELLNTKIIRNQGGSAFNFGGGGAVDLSFFDSSISNFSDDIQNPTSAIVINNSTVNDIIRFNANSFICNQFASGNIFNKIIDEGINNNVTYDVTEMNAHTSNIVIPNCNDIF